MSKNLLKSLPELIEAGVIDNDTAVKIEAYYNNKKGQTQNRIIIAFGILGAILVGLGLILIIAHNWDDIPRFTKAILAFIPLLVGQLACGYTLIKNKESIAWRESSSIFLFISIGATIALLSQIYVLGGTLPNFILSWMLLGLPIVYIMQASMSSLFYIAGITYYGILKGYWTYGSSESNLFWILLLAIIPYYYFTVRRKSESNFMNFHHWLIPISVTIMLGTIAHDAEKLMIAAYMSLFGLYSIISNYSFFKREKLWANGYYIIGSLGIVYLLFMLSFDWFWKDFSQGYLIPDKISNTPELFSTLILIVSAIGLLAHQFSRKLIAELPAATWAFLVFIVIFLIGYVAPTISWALVNMSLLGLGILNLWKGIKTDHLGILNFGLIIITILIVCRFFDVDLSFIFRGLLFILVGLGFFFTNYSLLKKRKQSKTL
jgi:uncharacterized membrane protein